MEQLQSPAVRHYFQHDPLKVLGSLEGCACLTFIDDPRRELDQRVSLRKRLDAAHDRAFDRYVLSAILADRAQTDLTRPAIFCSANTADFKPSRRDGKGIPPDIYRESRIDYCEDFRWSERLPFWEGRYGG